MSIFLILKKITGIAAEVSKNIPTKDDTLVGTIVKSLGLTRTLFSYFENSYIESLNLNNINKSNKYLVDLFYNSSLNNMFKTKNQEINDYTRIVEATAKDNKSKLYFLGYKYQGKVEPTNEFWHSKDFDFKSVLGDLWKNYDNRISIAFIKEGWNTKAVYNSFPIEDKPFYGSLEGDLEDFLSQHKKYQEKNISRTYLLYGPPGTGKSTFILKVAKELNLKTLRVSAEDITSLRLEDLFFLLQGLVPEIVIIDDIDRANDLKKKLPVLFQILSDLKLSFPDLTVMLTANNINALDSALIRPGRVDSYKEFTLPNKKEVKELLTSFGFKFEKLTEEEQNAIVDNAEGLSSAYLQEIGLQSANEFLDYSGLINLIKEMKKMSELK